MTTRLATSAKAPIVLTVDEGYGGQPQKRTTLTVDRATATVAKAELFENLSAGRRLRSWLRFAHTGEIYGLTGQTIAGLAIRWRRRARLHRSSHSPCAVWLRGFGGAATAAASDRPRAA